MSTATKTKSTPSATTASRVFWILNTTLVASLPIVAFLSLPYLSAHYQNTASGPQFDSPRLSWIPLLAVMAWVFAFGTLRERLSNAAAMRRESALVRYTFPDTPAMRALVYGVTGTATALLSFYAATHASTTDPGFTQAVLLCAALTSFFTIPASLRYTRHLMGERWGSPHMLVVLVGHPLLSIALGVSVFLTPQHQGVDTLMGTALAISLLIGIMTYTLVGVQIHALPHEDEEDEEPTMLGGFADRTTSRIYGDLTLDQRVKKTKFVYNVLLYLVVIVLGFPLLLLALNL